MLRVALISLVVLGAPDKDPQELDPAAKKLRTAWASQYEWREDGIKNVTLEFSWERTYTNADDAESTTRGTGQLVVVGNEIKRRHIDGAGAWSADIVQVLEWAAARYVREPYEEVFKDVKPVMAGQSPSGAEKIKAGDVTYSIKNDRIVAESRLLPIGKRKIETYVSFKLDDMGDGYARMRESFTRSGERGRKFKTEYLLTPRTDSPIPMPASVSLLRERLLGGKFMLTIKFGEPVTNREFPVIIEKEAQELVRAAWSKRYVLPREIRVQSEFQRKPDKALRNARWQTDVKGELQIWGLDEIKVELSEKSIRHRGQRARVTETCVGHMRECFGRLKDVLFEEEFKDCGFVLAQKGENVVVQVFGYAKGVAFLLQDGAITGVRANSVDPDAWTYMKLKAAKGGMLIDRLTRTVEGVKLTAKISYARLKGFLLPKTFQALVVPGAGRSDIGTVEYAFKHMKVTPPKD